MRHTSMLFFVFLFVMGMVFVAGASNLCAWFPPKPAEAPPPPPEYLEPDNNTQEQTLDALAVDSNIDPPDGRAPGFVRSLLGVAERVIGAIGSFAVGTFLPSGFHVFG